MIIRILKDSNKIILIISLLAFSFTLSISSCHSTTYLSVRKKWLLVVISAGIFFEMYAIQFENSSRLCHTITFSISAFFSHHLFTRLARNPLITAHPFQFVFFSSFTSSLFFHFGYSIFMAFRRVEI